MNVLVLGKIPSPLTPILKENGCRIIEYDAQVDIEFLRKHSVDFVVSYGYRHVVRKFILDYLREKVINLHISLLPLNRGADPNLWSFLEDTPKGVTIHYMDEGLDTGDIIAQKEVFFESEGETLATTYEKLNEEIAGVFAQHWPFIMRGDAKGQAQPQGGSFHRMKDKEEFEYLLLEKGWNTPARELIGRALLPSEKGV